MHQKQTSLSTQPGQKQVNKKERQIVTSEVATKGSCCFIEQNKLPGRYLIDLLSSFTDSQGFWAQFFNIQMTLKNISPPGKQRERKPLKPSKLFNCFFSPKVRQYIFNQY